MVRAIWIRNKIPKTVIAVIRFFLDLSANLVNRNGTIRMVDQMVAKNRVATVGGCLVKISAGLKSSHSMVIPKKGVVVKTSQWFIFR